MSGSRTKKIRAAFEQLTNLRLRHLSDYKRQWRAFKKSIKRR